MDNIKHLFKHLIKRHHNKPQEVGQGLVEYALILIFVGIATVAIVQLLGPAIDNTFDRFVRRAPVAPPALVNYTPPPTYTPTATTDPNVPPTNTPIIQNIPTDTPIPPTATNTAVPPTATQEPTNTPTATATVPCAYAPANVPANGSVVVQAENYMCGGQGQAYNDYNSGGSGGCATYRIDEVSPGVDLESSGDDGTCSIGWIADGEWTRYEVTAATTQQYYFTMRIASASSGRIRIRITNRFGTQQTSALTLPITGGWNNWTNYIIDDIPLSLDSGSTNIIEVYTERNGYNFNYFSIDSSPPATPAPEGILFVVGNTNLNVGDRAVRDRLQANGHTLIIVDDNAVNTADATGKELVIISSTSNANYVGPKFRDVSVPVMLWEPYLYDDMGMTSDNSSYRGTDSDENRVRIRNSVHPLAARLSTGNHYVIDNGNSNTFSWGRPSGSATAELVATTRNSSDNHTIFGYETGRTMYSGVPAPARRVGFFLHDSTAADLNSTGWQLFDAAVNWALGDI